MNASVTNTTAICRDYFHHPKMSLPASCVKYLTLPTIPWALTNTDLLYITIVSPSLELHINGIM